jgi:hypothetical protein
MTKPAILLAAATLDQTVLQAAVVTFASGEIDRAELMRRITRR